MIYSFSPFGYEGSMVNIEVDLRRGIPSVDIVGVSDSSVKEIRERVFSAFHNSNIEFPSERVLISLSPADLKKEGTSFDLPIALAVFLESKGINKDVNPYISDTLVMGQLRLSGEVLNVSGVNAALQSAVTNGIRFAIVPHSDNLIIPKGIKVATVGSLNEAIDRFLSLGDPKFYAENTEDSIPEFKVEFEKVSKKDSIDNIEDHNGLKVALAVAIAGRHNLLNITHGYDERRIFDKVPQLLPKLTSDEMNSVNRIYSLAGLPRKDNTRPFRMPHQTASIEGMCGGGASCRAGEISLAHNGVLFLDEAMEFKSSVLHMLRVPLESWQISLCRAGRTTVFPAKFQLFMNTMPCPCGNYGSKDRICLCTAKSIEVYWKKLSTPLTDRMSIRVTDKTEENTSFVSLTSLRTMIKTAWLKQNKRQQKFNQDLSPEEVAKVIKLDNHTKIRLDKFCEINNLSIRSRVNIIKVARTIADMGGAKDVKEEDLISAINLYAFTPLEKVLL